MELLVIPVLLSLGALLLFLGVGEMPAAQTIPGFDYFRRSGERPAVKTMSFTPPSSAPIIPSMHEPEFSESDALLSDVLSEMLQIREELKDLREQLAQLTKDESKQTGNARRRNLDY